jgi:hypothetical protein
MFRPNSRYAKVPTVTARLATGEEVVALKLRTLPPTTGVSKVVAAGDRLDVLSLQSYGDGTMFWHIADANTALDSRTLVENPGDTLNVPET